MINNYSYVSIKEILSQILDHPMLSDVTIEQAIRYTLQFIAKFGFADTYEHKEIDIQVTNYKAMLPCDLVRILQVKYKDINLRQSTDVCNPTDTNHNKDIEYTYSIKGRYLYCSVKECKLHIAYSAIKVDEDGFPMLIDNPIYIETLEYYIKKRVFEILFDQNKISQNVLQHTEQQYSWLAGQLQSELTIPDYAEMESIKNMWTSLIQNDNAFIRGFNYSNYKKLRI